MRESNRLSLTLGLVIALGAAGCARQPAAPVQTPTIQSTAPAPAAPVAEAPVATPLNGRVAAPVPAPAPAPAPVAAPRNQPVGGPSPRVVASPPSAPPPLRPDQTIAQPVAPERPRRIASLSEPPAPPTGGPDAPQRVDFGQVAPPPAQEKTLVAQAQYGAGYPYPTSPYTEQPYSDPAYGGQQPTQGGGYGAAVDPRGPVTVALLTPETDRRAPVRALAKALKQAAALAAKEIGDSKLVLRSYDTGGDAQKAAAAAQQALEGGASMILGPLFSGSAAAVGSVAQSWGAPVIAFTTDEAALGDGVYSIGFLPRTEIARMMRYARKRGMGTVAAMAPDTPYGALVYDHTRRTAQQAGVTLARVQPFKPQFEAMDGAAKDFASFYKSSPGLDAVLLATSGKTLQALAAYLAYNDVLPSKVKYMGLGAWDDPETFREATLRDGWFPASDPEARAAFDGRYKAAYGEEPPVIAMLGHDSVAVAAALLASARKSGAAPFSRAALEDAAGFSGASGAFRFMADGGNERAMAIMSVGRRSFEVVEPAPRDFSRQVTSLGQ